MIWTVLLGLVGVWLLRLCWWGALDTLPEVTNFSTPGSVPAIGKELDHVAGDCHWIHENPAVVALSWNWSIVLAILLTLLLFPVPLKEGLHGVPNLMLDYNNNEASNATRSKRYSLKT